MDNKDKLAMDALAGSAGIDGIEIDSSAFSDGNSTENLEGANEETIDSLVDKLNEENEELTIEEKLKRIGITKDQAIDYIMQLSDNGFVEEDISIFGGKFKAKFKTAKISDTRKFVELFDAMDINTQAKAEYYLNLYALASILEEYNGNKLEADDIVERADWIEEHIPVPVYKTLLFEANKFHAKIELLGSEEIADFF